MKKRMFLVLALAAQAMAQVPTEFPPGATEIAPAALTEALNGKVFAVKLANSSTWRLEYRANGQFFINTSGGYNDTGKWTVKDSQLCSDPTKSKASCNDMRLVGSRLHLKRDSGEIIELVPQ
jgi:hypothetical protein